MVFGIALIVILHNSGSIIYFKYIVYCLISHSGDFPGISFGMLDIMTGTVPDVRQE